LGNIAIGEYKKRIINQSGVDKNINQAYCKKIIFSEKEVIFILIIYISYKEKSYIRGFYLREKIV
jgi:hypothetical protein